MVVRIESVNVTNTDPCSGEFEVDDAVRIDDRYLQEGLLSPRLGDSLMKISGLLIYVGSVDLVVARIRA